jgi:hypothetical protein
MRQDRRRCIGGSRVALSLARSVMTEHGPTHTNGAEAFPPDNRYCAGESSSRLKYSRVLLKLGGEMFSDGQIGWQYRARWRVRRSER